MGDGAEVDWREGRGRLSLDAEPGGWRVAGSGLLPDDDDEPLSVRERGGRNASGGAGRLVAGARCWFLSASADAVGWERDGPGPMGRCDELEAGLAGPSDVMDLAAESAPESERRGGRLGVPAASGANVVSGVCRSVSKRLYAICLFLSPDNRLKMMARMSGKYRFNVSWEGSSARARSRISRRSRGTESRSLRVRVSR